MMKWLVKLPCPQVTQNLHKRGNNNILFENDPKWEEIGERCQPYQEKFDIV